MGLVSPEAALKIDVVWQALRRRLLHDPDFALLLRAIDEANFLLTVAIETCNGVELDSRFHEGSDANLAYGKDALPLPSSVDC